MNLDVDNDGAAMEAIPLPDTSTVVRRSQGEKTLHRKQREHAAYKVWVEVRSFTKVGEQLGLCRQYARQLVLGGWRIEVRAHRDAAYPGRRSPKVATPACPRRFEGPVLVSLDPLMHSTRRDHRHGVQHQQGQQANHPFGVDVIG
jgi:hypothetical protein